MIDPAIPLQAQVERQSKIIEALIRRANREDGVGGSVYALFQSAIALQGEVWAKTRDLEQALDTLGQASSKLEIAEYAREQTERNLSDALEAMEGGFALFTDGELEVFNDQFRAFLPDLKEQIKPGLPLQSYFQLVEKSGGVRSVEPSLSSSSVQASNGMDASWNNPSVVELLGDRWFQITKKTASENKTVLLSTEITHLVRQNRLEKNRLIDEHGFFLQAAFDHMTQGVCTFSKEGTLLINNDRFRELLHLPIALVQKGTAIRQIMEFVKKHNLLIGMSTDGDFEQILSEIKDSSSFERIVRHAHGSILNIRVHELPDQGFIMNVLDITAETRSKETLEEMVHERTGELTEANRRLREQHEEQILIDDELRRAKTQAEEAVRSKTRFFAAASHDLLQPINAAKLLISTMNESAAETPFEDTVSRLGRSFDSIEALLHTLLDISRLDSVGAEFAISSFSIGDLLHSIREDFTPVAEKKKIELRVVSCGLWVESDRRYLLRSIQNLVTNAIQYTKSGKVVVGCRRVGSNIILQVWDTGIGISKSDQKRIFSEFTRVTSERSEFGMGLGLSIVDRACERLGHPLSVQSAPGYGSVFSISLPVVPSPQIEDLPIEPEITDFPEDMDLIVLIVEDNPDVLFATARQVESWGGSVLTASSTREAVAQIEEIGMAPDIILADYQLGDNDDGIKAIKAIRKETGTRVPAIVITASPVDELAESSRKLGFTVLPKPVKLSRLRSLMDWTTRQPVVVCEQF